MLSNDAEHQEGQDSELSLEEFTRLIEQYNNRNLAEGEVVRGRILKILENEVIVDIGNHGDLTDSHGEHEMDFALHGLLIVNQTGEQVPGGDAV